MTFYDLIPDDYITTGTAALVLQISEREVIEKLRTGELSGVYSPYWNVGEPRWFVELYQPKLRN